MEHRQIPQTNPNGTTPRYVVLTAIQCTAVGLTRIELVTSSLSGMRSNQLSYSPELPSGRFSLLPLSVTLNRGDEDFFFQY